MRRPGRARTLALGTALLLAGCAEDPTSEPATAARPETAPNLLLITVDTLRPDALGWIGGGSHTPVIDRLAAEGFAFSAAVSPVPLTLPAHATMFSGLDPVRHGVHDNHQVLGVEPVLLAERLRQAGYETAAFVSGYPLTAGFGLARGFDHYDDRLTTGDGAWLERPAGETTAAAVDWLATAGEPWLVWVHYYDAHLPYEPPPELALDGWRGAYDGEVAYVDRAIGDLVRAAGGAGRPWLTFFAADHGESLGEHGEATHGFFVYDSTMLVPMIVHFPGRVPAGRSTAPVRLADVTPTLLDLLGLAPLGEVDGLSVTALLDGGRVDLPAAWIETVQPWTSYGWAPLAGLRAGEWKLIDAPRPELYDLAADPAEERNLYADEPEIAALLERELEQRRRQAATGAVAVVDDATRAQLEALGYLGGGELPDELPDDLVDPKDRVAMRESLTEGAEALADGRHRPALAIFDRVLAEEPENRFALTRSAEALAALGALPAAIERLERARVLDPGHPEIHTNLALYLERAGRADEAIDAWRQVVRLQPGNAQGWTRIGGALGRAGRVDEAVEALTKAAGLDEDDPAGWTRLAFAEFAARDLPSAAEHLERAADLAPDGFAHAGALGLILDRLGRYDEALGWLDRSTSREPEYAEARYAAARIATGRGETGRAAEALAQAVQAQPSLRQRAQADPALSALLR